MAQVVQREGLSLIWPGRQVQRVYPDVITSLVGWDRYDDLDLVLVTVKAFDTEAAMFELIGRLPQKTKIMSLQNGVGNEETLLRLFPQNSIVAGSITLPVEIPQVGNIRVSKVKGGIGVASVTAEADLHNIIVNLEKAGFVVATYADYQSLKWSKLMMNLTCNAVSAILDMPPAAVLTKADLFNLELAAWRETLQVMQAQHIQVVALPSYPIPILAQALTWLPNIVLRRLLKDVMAGGRGNKLPSLQLELQRGRSDSEVSVLNGAVMTAGRKVDLAVPVNQGIYEILSGIVSGNLPWFKFKAKPDALLTCVYNQRKEDQ